MVLNCKLARESISPRLSLLCLTPRPPSFFLSIHPSVSPHQGQSSRRCRFRECHHWDKREIGFQTVSSPSETFLFFFFFWFVYSTASLFLSPQSSFVVRVFFSLFIVKQEWTVFPHETSMSIDLWGSPGPVGRRSEGCSGGDNVFGGPDGRMRGICKLSSHAGICRLNVLNHLGHLSAEGSTFLLIVSKTASASPVAEAWVSYAGIMFITGWPQWVLANQSRSLVDPPY